MAGQVPRVLIYSVAYFPFVGGAEVAVREITDRLGEFDYDLITVDLDGKQAREERIGNVRVYRVGRGKLGKYLFPFLGAWKGYRLHRERPYQTVWAIMANYAGFAALFFSYLAPGTYFLLTLQEGDPLDHIKRRVRFVPGWFRRIFSQADRIQAISTYLAEFGRAMGHKKEVIVIPNGVDIKLFGTYFSEREIADLRQELGLPEDRIYLVTTSRLVVKNGLADVIRALALLPARVEFLVIGSGPEEAGLRQLAEELGVAGRVHFLGERPYRDLPLYLHLGRIFVRPSLSEGMGNSFIEAMAAGIPVVGTPVGGIVDFLRHKETGWLCEPRNPESLAEIIAYLVDEDRRVAVMEVIHRARQLVYTSYDWNQVASDIRPILFPKR